MEFFGVFLPILAIIGLGAAIFAASRYKRCPTDKVIVVYGGFTKLEHQNAYIAVVFLYGRWFKIMAYCH